MAESRARVYLDGASSAPLHPRAREALAAALDDGWADPRRLHAEGRRARMLLDGAREAVAAVLGARTEEVRFAPSHAAAVHTGLLGVLAGRRRVGRVVVASAVEHSSVLHAAAFAGEAPVLVPVDRLGRVDVEAFAAAVSGDGVGLACLQHANGEVGTVQPVEAARAAAQARRVPLLVDAGASVGHLPAPAAWDVLAADASAWGGPPGVGVLAVRAGVRWRNPWPEDGAEPVAVPSALAAAVALQAVEATREAEAARRRALVELLRSRIPATVPDVEVVGDPASRLPHVLTFSCLYADGEALVTELDRRGFAVGSGSACTASTVEPSHVLAAMGVLTHGNVRLGLPVGVAEADVRRFADELPAAVAAVRALIGTEGL